MNKKEGHIIIYRCKIWNNKSQMEAFGLAVIVVLITIGFFIFLSLRNQNPSPDIKKDYIVDQTATNFINSIVNVDVKECYDSGYTVSKLLKACATNEKINCGTYTDPCSLANSTIYTILNRTLIKENYRFRLYTRGLNWNIPNYAETDINLLNGPCSDNDAKGMMGTFPVLLYPIPGQVSLSLGICTGG
jgi:hypothetical protein